MFTKEVIKKILESYIEKTENLGDQTGGSGHMGFVSYSLAEFNSRELPDEKVEVIFKYVISIESEFTYYPDNPPMETEYEKKIVLDKNKNVISEEILSSNAEWLNDDMIDPFWFDSQEKITRFVEELLSKIEWNYGDNRAPIKYPPKYYYENEIYKCVVELEDDGGNLTYSDKECDKLAQKVINDLKNKFLPGNDLAE